MTPNGFFLKFQGASFLCLLSELCLYCISVSLLVALLPFHRAPVLLEAGVPGGSAVHTCHWDNHTFLSFVRRVGGEKKKVELAIKYVWHILFNFACNFFLVHRWGFSDMVTQHFTFIVQGMPSWFLCWFYCSDCGMGLSILLSTTWSFSCPPSKFIFREVFVSQIKTLLEPKVVADGYLWIFFFFFLLEVDCLKIGILLCSIQNLARCRVHYKLQFGKLAVLKFCQYIILGILTVSPKHWFLQQHFSCIKEERPLWPKIFKNHCTNSYVKWSFAVILFSLQYVMVPECC